MTGPAGNQRHTDTTLVKRSLESSQRLDAGEEVIIDLAFQMCGAVVGGEDDDRVVGQVEFLEQVEDAADVGVEPGDHRRISGPGSEVRGVTATFQLGERRVLPLQGQVGFQGLVGHVQRQVRNHRGVIEEEGAILVLFDESQGLCSNPVRGVVLSLEAAVVARVGGIGILGKPGVATNRRIVFQCDTLVVVPEVGRVIAVGVPLAVVAEETVKTLLQWSAFGSGGAEPPLAEGPGRIPV